MPGTKLFAKLQDPLYTYAYFEKIDLLRIKSKIASVATHSSMEEELLNQIEQIENFWHSEHLRVEKNQLQEYELTKTEHLIIQIDDTLL